MNELEDTKSIVMNHMIQKLAQSIQNLRHRLVIHRLVIHQIVIHQTVIHQILIHQITPLMINLSAIQLIIASNNLMNARAGKCLLKWNNMM